MLSLLAAALGAPVVCDPDAARRILEDARLLPERVPATQPQLLPGLARGSGGELAQALDRLCAGGGLSLAPAETWETAAWSAYSFVLTRSDPTDCALVQQAAALSVAVRPGEPPRYSLRGHLPQAITPVGPCDTPARYRTEEVVDGADGPVRLVLARDWEGERPTHARVLVRHATAAGWREQVLLDPAPDRLVDPQAGGPRIALSGADERTWIVAYGDRERGPEDCQAVPGQTVWRWQDPSWVAERGRAALGLLADRGAWRLAGQDGWFLILAQDSAADRELLEARGRRLQRRTSDPLSIHDSASFPLMNAGFLILTPDPWPTEAEAERARQALGRWAGAYVRQGWRAADPCPSP